MADGASTEQKGRRGRKRLVFLLVFVLACLALWVFRVPALTRLGRLLVVSEEPVPADAIIVLGGNLQTRPFAAASLYARGLAPLVVVAKNAKKKTDEMGVTVDEATAAVAILRREGVPETAIKVTERIVFSTRDEAETIGQMARDAGWRTIVIPTDPFHTRRTKWIFRHTLTDVKCVPKVSAIENAEANATNWWLTENGLLTFHNEVVKGFYYWVRGADPLPPAARQVNHE